MKKYKCKVCGYVYYPAKGDAKSNIGKNTPFENLDSSWLCPICGAGKDRFIGQSK